MKADCRSILRTCGRAKRENNASKTPLPLEMLPKKNRICGKIGHDWDYGHDRKRCKRYGCEVNRPYTPNPCRVG